MDPLNEIREAQKASWNKFSPGWKKWDHLTMDFLQPVGDEMIKFIDPKPTDHVLDVASGTGQPAITIAKMVHQGSVMMTDISEGMLATANERAELERLKNIQSHAGDICQNPFEDGQFDAVTCRFGYMFFPDMDLATQELYRVLRTDGRIAVAVWAAPAHNYWVTAIMDRIRQNMELPPPPPGSPGIFRCAEEGIMTDLFEAAGFRNVRTTEVKGLMQCGDTDTYWNMMMDVGAPIVAALNQADKSTRNRIKSQVYEDMKLHFPDGNVAIPSLALVIYGEK